jgi:hypothetical protein
MRGERRFEMELFLIGSNSGSAGVSKERKTLVKGLSRTGKGRLPFGKAKTSPSSLREEIRLMLYLSSRLVNEGKALKSEDLNVTDSLSSRCA